MSLAPARGRLAVVRAAQPHDVEELVALCAEHAHFERSPYEVAGKAVRLSDALFGAAPRLIAWLAVLHGSIVGYATATQEYSTWNAAAYLHMDCLYVRRGYRSQGVGRMLLRTVCEFARAHALPEVQWQTPAWNTDACRFYERHAATVTAKLRFRLPLSPNPTAGT